jgi:RNA polymerase sigma-70 factor (ECF subfamily)
VANAFSRFAALAPHVEITTPLVNGTVGVRVDPGGEFDTAITFVVEDGRITRMYAMRNPHKLGRLDDVADLRR